MMCCMPLYFFVDCFRPFLLAPLALEGFSFFCPFACFPVVFLSHSVCCQQYRLLIFCCTVTVSHSSFLFSKQLSTITVCWSHGTHSPHGSFIHSNSSVVKNLIKSQEGLDEKHSLFFCV